jgi:hypothetical protein
VSRYKHNRFVVLHMNRFSAHSTLFLSIKKVFHTFNMICVFTMESIYLFINRFETNRTFRIKRFLFFGNRIILDNKFIIKCGFFNIIVFFLEIIIFNILVLNGSLSFTTRRYVFNIIAEIVKDIFNTNIIYDKDK